MCSDWNILHTCSSKVPTPPTPSAENHTYTYFTFQICYAKSLQSCLTLCDPTDGSPPGSPIPEILQARTLEWVAISFSNAWKWKVKIKSFSRVWLLATPWTAAYQAPPSMGFSRQEYWSGVPLPSPVVYIYTMKWYSAIKKNQIMPLAATWVGLDIIILNEVNQER